MGAVEFFRGGGGRVSVKVAKTNTVCVTYSRSTIHSALFFIPSLLYGLLYVRFYSRYFTMYSYVNYSCRGLLTLSTRTYVRTYVQ